MELAIIVAMLVLGTLVVAWLVTKNIDKKIEKGFQPQGVITPVEGGAIHALKQGAGPALILIHGLAGNALNFRALATLLSSQYTVYSIDRPGSGFSERDNTTPASFKIQSRMILEWMTKVNIEKAFLVGHSMGGAISLRLAIDAKARIKAVTLLCPLTTPPNQSPGPLAFLHIPQQWLRTLLANTLSTPLRLLVGKRQLAQVFSPEQVPLHFNSESGGALGLHSKGFYQASSDMVASVESLNNQIDLYDGVTCPVGILFGSADTILDPHAHMSAITSVLPDCLTDTIEHAGHMILNTQPSVCEAFINNVNRQYK